MRILRPLLAAAVDTDVDLQALQYPLLSSPKVDGIRCLVSPTEGPLSRSFKPIPNLHIRESLERSGAWYLDGELVTLGVAGAVDAFNDIQSKVMSAGGRPRFLFLAFDYFESPTTSFVLRHSLARWKAKHIADAGFDFVRGLPHRTVHDPVEVLAEEHRALSAGFEGLMLRDPEGRYKSGRSTLREQYLLKLKRFHTAEGRVINIFPLMRNLNPQERNELGLARRSSHQSNLIPDALMGSLVVDIGHGQHLSIGSGFTLAQRADIWENRDVYHNRLVTYKFLPGGKSLPRHPIFIGFRHLEDT